MSPAGMALRRKGEVMVTYVIRARLFFEITDILARVYLPCPLTDVVNLRFG